MSRLIKKEIPEYIDDEPEGYLVGINDTEHLPVMIPQSSVNEIVRLYAEGEELAFKALVLYLQWRTWRLNGIPITEEMALECIKVNTDELKIVEDILEKVEFY